mmetsp:Transcript_38063/g.151126  ORF Transcript_38063/g.151126 Transcript_38063/m.151126 type:complete len:910 (-) Transcript_38063:550-3279(-)|eukprot:CAMPEP_0113955776 /NCGR_PEP_ID=MMETSP0011_2-20120614/1594_1 /TAXON_ID=101924 /ORGANISM="Rhodosorus marinus" /LENGTH=909 /DNA_ID=CAMNT_0000965649 /DNA_START=633 /DNA_END=3362 /DNA_ORIENTATION=+ /assembly_acc=CAM_ASM_000156
MDRGRLLIKNLDLDPRFEVTRSSKDDGLNLGWLLRLFRSDFFDAWMAIAYIYKYRRNRGVLDYLCNELYNLEYLDMENYLPQISHMIVYHLRGSPTIERLLMDKCASSVHFALQVYWFLEASVEDAILNNLGNSTRFRQELRTRCEISAVNGPFNMHTEDAKEMELATYELSRESVAVDPRSEPKEGGMLETQPVSRTSALNEQGDDRSWNESQLGDMLEKCLMEDVKSESGSERDARPSTVHFETDSDAWPEVRDVVEDHLAKVSGKPISDASKSEGNGSEDRNDQFSDNERDSDKVDEAEIVHAEEDEEKHEVSHEPRVADDPVEEPGHALDDEGTISTEGKSLTPETDPLGLARCEEERKADEGEPVKGDGDIDVSPPGEHRDAPGPRRDSSGSSLSQSSGRYIYDYEKPEQELRAVSAKALRRKLVEIHNFLEDEGDEGHLDALRYLTLKQERFNYFNDSLQLMRDLMTISIKLRKIPKGERKKSLKASLKLVDALILERVTQDLEEKTPAAAVAAGPNSFLRAPHIPLIRSEKRAMRMLRTLPDESIVLSTKERVPYMLFVEVVRSKLINSDGSIFCEHIVHDQMKFVEEPEERVPQEDDVNDKAANRAREKMLGNTFGELWEDKEKRILRNSPFNGIPDRQLYAFIVKAGDDLRQEQLAIQLITQFDSIFRSESVQTILRPFTIICLASDAGLVELVPNAVTIHGLKKKSPKLKSLRQFFEIAFGPVDSNRFTNALSTFVRSLAGYSLVSYFLQLKDRHNGNIMLDSSGCLIHIDFGYMLSNTPGNINFEAAPFKLSQDFVGVMGGHKSSTFQMFRELFVAGFMAARKHSEVIITLVEIMVEGTQMPCMKGGKPLVDHLRKRFFPGIPEKEAISKINKLVNQSYHNQWTVGYDKFQYWTNDIL